MQPSEKEVGLGQTFQVYLRGEPNQTVRVLLYFEGLERREGPGQGPFRIGLDANGTARPPAASAAFDRATGVNE